MFPRRYVCGQQYAVSSRQQHSRCAHLTELQEVTPTSMTMQCLEGWCPAAGSWTSLGLTRKVQTYASCCRPASRGPHPTACRICVISNTKKRGCSVKTLHTSPFRRTRKTQVFRGPCCPGDGPIASGKHLDCDHCLPAGVVTNNSSKHHDVWRGRIWVAGRNRHVYGHEHRHRIRVSSPFQSSIHLSNTSTGASRNRYAVSETLRCVTVQADVLISDLHCCKRQLLPELARVRHVLHVLFLWPQLRPSKKSGRRELKLRLSRSSYILSSIQLCL